MFETIGTALFYVAGVYCAWITIQWLFRNIWNPRVLWACIKFGVPVGIAFYICVIR